MYFLSSGVKGLRDVGRTAGNTALHTALGFVLKEKKKEK